MPARTSVLSYLAILILLAVAICFDLNLLPDAKLASPGTGRQLGMMANLHFSSPRILRYHEAWYFHSSVAALSGTSFLAVAWFRIMPSLVPFGMTIAASRWLPTVTGLVMERGEGNYYTFELQPTAIVATTGILSFLWFHGCRFEKLHRFSHSTFQLPPVGSRSLQFGLRTAIATMIATFVMLIPIKNISVLLWLQSIQTGLCVFGVYLLSVRGWKSGRYSLYVFLFSVTASIWISNPFRLRPLSWTFCMTDVLHLLIWVQLVGFGIRCLRINAKHIVFQPKPSFL